MQSPTKRVYSYPNTTNIQKIESEKLLANFRKMFDPVLQEFLKEKIKQAREISPQAIVLPLELYRVARNGGKRLRPMFVYAGYLAAKGMAADAIILASLSVELLHTFAMIHDDILDRSNLRRKIPTTHKFFEQNHNDKKLKGDSQWNGLSVAILAGDLASTFASEILNSAPFPHERVRKAKYYFDKMKEEAEYGEYLDLVSGTKEQVSEDEVLKILEYKTGKYTVERPLHLGAALAGADTKIYETMTAYALPFGQAFQTQDDILGTFGDEKEIGKPSDSDIKEGKKTLLVVKAFETASKGQKELLKKVLGNRKASKEKIEEVRNIFKETGSLDYAVSLASLLLNRSRQVAEDSDFDNTGKEYLIAAVDYLQSRPL